MKQKGRFPHRFAFSLLPLPRGRAFRCDFPSMSDTISTQAPPMPKPRTRHKLLLNQPSRVSVSANNVPDENQCDRRGRPDCDATGAPPASVGEDLKSAVIPDGSGSNCPTDEIKDRTSLINGTDDQAGCAAPSQPTLEESCDQSSSSSCQDASFAVWDLLENTAAGTQSHTNFADLSHGLPDPCSSSPPLSPTENLDSILKNLADWATEPADDSSADDESQDPLPVQKLLDKASESSTTNTSVPQVSAETVRTVSDKLPPQPRKELSVLQTKPVKQRLPRVATIRVSRKKQSAISGGGPHSGEGSFGENVVSRSSWLDVWQGRRHHVLWATLDGQIMCLWKKRTDRFTEVVFHVSSITDVRVQEQGRFCIYFQKKRIEFMAHSQVVQDGWVSSLLAARGQEPPAPPEHQGPLSMKEPRSKVYAALCGHNLWIYHNKEDFGFGVGMTCVSMNVASVKPTGRHSFSLITPYKTFNFSTDSSKDLNVWQDSLTQGIRSALSCSEVARRLWVNPANKVCADCGEANPEWASVNLLVVICDACAGQHRSLGINVSKVRSLKLDSKVWTNPLIQLFMQYGNKAANDVWGYSVPATEQIQPDSSPNQRAAFTKAKYCRGRYKRPHPLASSLKLMNQRLCEVVRGPDVAETLSLLASGARVQCQSGDPDSPSPIALAENAKQALQTELLRHNEYTEIPTFSKRLCKQSRSMDLCSSEEELHGKLEDDRFLFSQENDSAACDVMDLKEVVSVFDCSSGPTNEFEVLTLTDKLLCSADTRQDLLLHLMHILKVILPGTFSNEDLQGVQAVSRVLLRDGASPQHSEAWVALRHDEVLVFHTEDGAMDRLRLTADRPHKLNASENTIEVVTASRTLTLQFEMDSPCQCWDVLLKVALLSKEKAHRRSLYQLPASAMGSVPPAMERCISHITLHGLKVEGIYRRCGMVTKINQLVEALNHSPRETRLDTDELSVLDVAGALKQFVRQKVVLIPDSNMEHWVKASAVAEEAQRLQVYRKLLDQLPPDSRISLSALCGHLYIVQMYSQENRMTAHNLAVVFVPTLFQEFSMSADMVRVTRELILHYTLLFQRENHNGAKEEDVIVTVL
ncbi:arf-GAP with Rho-GAP domain, ANK repeat and PH domain-containing protein 1 isoform X2 [Brienomyrus brachyistius]|uniref:arf-GAP with Rho-GAP domain, ANK repeat and PH domain-containing protein 1 isoform X2 n=1 Tax=Brienomyrus brachyistius TaxID=42636 RepID=UPI0020B227F1|nr:arf-GAP with Rho-GAP domain, ANK repeat and PH domain-containing protein 1 isoform X2 [Brienomyrus brachyistius]